MVVTLLLFVSALAQRPHVVLNDSKVVITEVEVTPGKPYTLATGRNGDVWVALNPVEIVTGMDRRQNRRKLQAGDAEFSDSTENLQFRVSEGSHAAVLVVRLKAPLAQKLTIEQISPSFEDASDRNQTLLVAITDCHFRDTRNIGDESEWIPSKPNVVMMRAGEVKWIRPGIHHFENLGGSAARLVSIEW